MSDCAVSNQLVHEISTDGGMERRVGLSYEEFSREYLQPLRPVVLTDATRQWRALTRWTPDFFRREFDSREINVWRDRRYTVSELIDLVESSSPEKPAPYLRNEYLADVFPELLGDVEPVPPPMSRNWLCGNFHSAQLDTLLNRCTLPEIYIGGAGGGFPFLHYDLYHTHAFLNQIYGRKLFVIYSPQQTGFLYPNPEIPNQSMVDIASPDFTKHPLFAKAVPIKFVLEPGETIFVPAGWWHTTRMLSASITVSVNHASESNWTNVVHDVQQSLRQSPNRATRWAAGPIAAYLHGIGLFNSLARS